MPRKIIRRRIPQRRQPVNLRPRRIRQPHQLARLVKTLARRIINRPPQHPVLQLRFHQHQHRVPAAHNQGDVRLKNFKIRGQTPGYLHYCVFRSAARACLRHAEKFFEIFFAKSPSVVESTPPEFPGKAVCSLIWPAPLAQVGGEWLTSADIGWPHTLIHGEYKCAS